MTPEQGNKLIHTWLGKSYETDRKIMILKYNTSWDWLMPVVEKISNYHYPDYFSHSYPEEERNPYEDCAYMRTFGMRDGEGNYMVRINSSSLFCKKTLIEAAWEAVVDFIQYHNDQHPQG